MAKLGGSVRRLRWLSIGLMVLFSQVAQVVVAAAPQGNSQADKSVQAADKSDQPKKPRIVDVSGSAVDAVTGQPIRHFIVQGGFFKLDDPDKVSWGFSERRSFGEGRFRISVRWEQGWTARIIADGYLPKPVITQAPPVGKDRMRVVVRLQPGSWVQGQVVDHLGNPLVGASVFAVGPRGVDVEQGRAVLPDNRLDDKSAVGAVTNEQGEFDLPIGEANSLVVSSPHLNAWPSALPKTGEKVQVALPEPARVVVYYDIDHAPDQHQVFFQMLSDRMPGFEGIRFGHRMDVKKGEPYVIKGVTPGSYQIARYRTVGDLPRLFGRMLDRQFFAVKPGETKAVRFVRLAASPVSGRVLGLPEAMLNSALIRVCPLADDVGHKVDELRELDVLMTGDRGEFETEPLEPGRYRVFVEGYAGDVNRFVGGIERPSHVAETDFTIPESGVAPLLELKIKKR